MAACRRALYIVSDDELCVLSPIPTSTKCKRVSLSPSSIHSISEYFLDSGPIFKLASKFSILLVANPSDQAIFVLLLLFVCGFAAPTLYNTEHVLVPEHRVSQNTDFCTDLVRLHS